MTIQTSRHTFFPFMLVLYEIATYLSNDMYLPALPNMMKELQLSMQQAQMTLTIWFVGAAVFPLFIGMISDRFGRRPVLVGGGYIYILATLLCAFTSDYAVMLTGRFIEGSMLATMSVAGYACIHESYEKIQAIKMLAIMGSITILAPAFGPLLGGIFLLVSDWRMIFLFIAFWALVSVIMLTIWMPETLPPEERHPLQPIKILWQYWAVIMNKQFTLLALVVGLLFGGFIMWITAGPLLLIKTFHLSPVLFGSIQAVVFIAYMGANFLAKQLADKMDIKKLIWIGLMISLVGGGAMLLTGVMPHTLEIFILAMTIFSFGSGLCFAPLSRNIIEASTAPMGLRVALSNVLMISFGAAGSVVVALQFDGTIPSLAYPVAVTAFAAVCLSYFTLGKMPLGTEK